MKFICKRCGYEFQIIGKIRKGGCTGAPYVLKINLIKKAIQCPKCKTVEIKQLK